MKRTGLGKGLSGRDKLTPGTNPLPRLFMEEECDGIDTGFDDRNAAGKRHRPCHHMATLKPIVRWIER